MNTLLRPDIFWPLAISVAFTLIVAGVAYWAAARTARRTAAEQRLHSRAQIRLQECPDAKVVRDGAGHVLGTSRAATLEDAIQSGASFVSGTLRKATPEEIAAAQRARNLQE